MCVSRLFQSSADRWHHVVMSYDGSSLKFYVDGVLKGSTPASGFTARVPCPLLIGSMYNTEYFYGLMDQVSDYMNLDITTLWHNYKTINVSNAEVHGGSK